VASKTPDEIVAAAKSAADSAKSVHVFGSVAGKSSAVTLDMELVAGEGGHGQLSENGLSFELIVTGGSVYIKGSPAFYAHVGSPAAAQLLQGKWLKAPTGSGQFASIGSLTDLRRLVDSALANHGTLAKGSTTTVNGQPAIAVNDVSKGGTLYVATTGQPYPIEVTKAGHGGGKVTFDRWNQPVTLNAPANAISLPALQSGH
jgi:hypothetical protein